MLCLSGLFVLASEAFAQQQGLNPDSFYRLSPDAQVQDGVPAGQIKGPFTLPSQAYPGTQHTYWVYVPAQYERTKPASLMVFQDGQAFLAPNGDVRANVVMDNLIFRREIPVMIGVFINPGRRPDQPEPTLSNWGDRDTNRPTEYNTLDDKYARVIVDELMPALKKDYNIASDPDRHGIGGSSSGAIAAFTVAWQRPDQFRKVLSNVGSFTDLRGGHVYPDLIRQSEKKPIRIFLADGRNDNRGTRPDGTYNEKRDWFLQNVRMQQALTEKGYEVNYSWGINRHGQKMLQTVFPEMMRWLWRDGPVSTDVHDEVERSLNGAQIQLMEDRKKLTAKGSFDVKVAPVGDHSDQNAIVQLTIDKTFHGDLEGTSKGVMLTTGANDKGSGGYAAMERVTGTLAGRKGTFALQHKGTMGAGKSEMDVIVVPASGTDGLKGLSGKLAIIIEGGKHSYVFDYSLGDAK